MNIQPRLHTILNKTLSPPICEHGYNLRIEQYRGLCALLVFIYHATIYEYLAVDHYSFPIFVHYFGAGGLSVLVFFCISGYVIGINHDSRSLDAKDYLKKRLIRLYPIYIFAMLLCLAVSVKTSWATFLGNLFFLQNDYPYIRFTVPNFVNFSTWSLNYEVLYYLLFIPLFYLRPKLWKLLSCMLFISILLVYCNNSIVIFANYLDGYYFWILGLIIGWSAFRSEKRINKPVPLLSLMFLQICQHHLGLGEIILHTIGINSPTRINWLFDLPFCLMVLCILTGRDNSFLRFNKILCYILPVFVFVYLLLHHRLTEDVRWIMCLIYWALSLLFYFETKISGFIMGKLTAVGKISYAIYLLHVPVGMLIKKTVFIQNQTVEVIVKYALWFTLTFALSYLLERVMQPAIKHFFFPKPAMQLKLKQRVSIR